MAGKPKTTGALSEASEKLLNELQHRSPAHRVIATEAMFAKERLEEIRAELVNQEPGQRRHGLIELEQDVRSEFTKLWEIVARNQVTHQ